MDMLASTETGKLTRLPRLTSVLCLRLLTARERKYIENNELGKAPAGPHLLFFCFNYYSDIGLLFATELCKK